MTTDLKKVPVGMLRKHGLAGIDPVLGDKLMKLGNIDAWLDAHSEIIHLQQIKSKSFDPEFCERMIRQLRERQTYLATYRVSKKKEREQIR